MNFQYVQLAERMWAGRQTPNISNEYFIDLTITERVNDHILFFCD